VKKGGVMTEGRKYDGDGGSLSKIKNENRKRGFGRKMGDFGRKNEIAGC